MQSEPVKQQEFNIRDYWQILVRRRWLIYVCALVTTVAAAVASFVATPVYRSTCQIAIERQGARILNRDLNSAEPSWLDYQNFYNTQYKIIQSNSVLRRAAVNLDLEHRNLLKQDKGGALSSLADFKAKVLHAVSRSAVPLGETDADNLAPYVKLLAGGLSVEPVRDSHLVNISYVHRDYKFAAEVPNAVALAYIEFMLSERKEIAERSKDYFLKQIVERRQEITQKEEALKAYADAHGIVLGDTREVALGDLEDIRKSLASAKTRLTETKARYNTYAQLKPDGIFEVRQNPGVAELTQKEAEAQGTYRKLTSTYGEAYPQTREARQNWESTRQRLDLEIEKVARQVVESARGEFLRAQNEVNNLTALLDTTTQRVGQYRTANIEYSSMNSEITQLRKTLDELQAGQNNMTLNAALGDTAHNVRVIDQATPSHSIFKPKKQLNIFLGLLFGLFIGVAAAVLIEYVDNTLKTPEDVRQVLGVAVLGMIPAQVLDAKARSKTRPAQLAAETPESNEVDPALITARQPISPVAEAYRELRTAVLLAVPGHPPRDLTVTSCQPSEGKTTTAINLAVALAQLGRRVLLIDTDLRRPRCHHVLRTSSARGVSTFLTGLSDLSGLVQPTAIERLSLIPAGPIPPNPAELLDSDRFRELVESLRNRQDYDHVIYDSPPTLSVVDPLLIGRHTEGTVLVVRSAFTSRDAGRLGLEKLRSGRVNVLGVVLNAVQTEHVPYHYQQYRYGYAKRNEQDAEDQDPAVASGGRKG